MNKFLKSVWFPILIFIVIELILFGFRTKPVIDCPSCEMCPPAPEPCPQCPCWEVNWGLVIIKIGTVLNLIISITTYLLIKKYAKE